MRLSACLYFTVIIVTPTKHLAPKKSASSLNRETRRPSVRTPRLSLSLSLSLFSPHEKQTFIHSSELGKPTTLRKGEGKNYFIYSLTRDQREFSVELLREFLPTGKRGKVCLCRYSLHHRRRRVCRQLTSVSWYLGHTFLSVCKSVWGT